MKRTGTIQPWRDAEGCQRYRARIRLRDGTRPWLPVPVGYSEARARDFAAHIQEQEDTRGELLAAKQERAREAARTELVAGAVETCDAWFAEWNRARKARGLTSTADNAGHYRHHIRPAVDGKHVRDWTAADLRKLVAALDAKIATGELSTKSASNVWGTATKMATDASRSKVPALRVREDNPAEHVEGPEGGGAREKQFLYPSEFLSLVACDAVPLRWRRAVAFAVYLYPRAGELRALRRRDVDLEHGTVHVHQAFERRTREVKSTKTGKGRRFAVEAEVMPLLAATCEGLRDNDLVCPLPNRLASRLRQWLTLAGVTRRELLDEGSATTKPLGFHDLRATGLTWMAVRGDEPLKIMQRAGHEDFATTQIYIRTAEAVRTGFGTVFPPLPPELVSGAGLPGRSTRVGRAAFDGVFGAGHGIRSRAPRESAEDIGGARAEAAPEPRVTARTHVAATPLDRPVDQPDGELLEARRRLVVDLRAMVADLRAENHRLREQLGEKPAGVVDLASRRGRP